MQNIEPIKMLPLPKVDNLKAKLRAGKLTDPMEQIKLEAYIAKRQGNKRRADLNADIFQHQAVELRDKRLPRLNTPSLTDDSFDRKQRGIAPMNKLAYLDGYINKTAAGDTARKEETKQFTPLKNDLLFLLEDNKAKADSSYKKFQQVADKTYTGSYNVLRNRQRLNNWTGMVDYYKKMRVKAFKLAEQMAKDKMKTMSKNKLPTKLIKKEMAAMKKATDKYTGLRSLRKLKSLKNMGVILPALEGGMQGAWQDDFTAQRLEDMKATKGGWNRHVYNALGLTPNDLMRALYTEEGKPKGMISRFLNSLGLMTNPISKNTGSTVAATRESLRNLAKKYTDKPSDYPILNTVADLTNTVQDKWR